MEKKINIFYLRELYNEIFYMTDDEISDNFQINDPKQRQWLLECMQRDFLSYGPKTQFEIMKSLEYLRMKLEIDAENFNEYKGSFVPNDLPFGTIDDLDSYFNSIYQTIKAVYPQPIAISPDAVATWECNVDSRD